MEHNLYIILLSLFVCFIFTLVSFEWIQRNLTKRTHELRYLMLGSITMGIAIWSLHYMGMLSIITPEAYIYNFPTMIISFGISIVVSYASFFLLSRTNKFIPTFILFGSGMIIVHAIGIPSMTSLHKTDMVPSYLIVSILSAYLFTGITFWAIRSSLRYKKFFASLSLLSGVSLMHYIGEMSFIPGKHTYSWQEEFHIANINILATLLVLSATIIILILYLIEQLNQKKIVEQKMELLESEQRYHSLFELNPEGVFVIGPKRNFMKVNKALESITGYTSTELLKIPYTKLLKKNEVNLSLNFLNRVLKGETVRHPLTVFHKEGYMVELEITTIPYIIHNKIIGAVGIAKDMTAVNEAQNFKQKAQTLAYVGELAAGLAHEIRNPLTSIKGFTQLFQAHQATEEDGRFLGIMLRETERINFIISQLMILAKPHMIIKKTIDLNEMVKRAFKFLDEEADFEDVHVQLKLAEGPIHFIGEENLLTQLFLNLFKNAVEAMTTGGTISVNLEDRDEQIHIQVTDDGPGIPQGILPNIGQPFYTTKEGNPGLGLLICYHIAEHHGGKLQIDSIEGQGTTVSLSFTKKIANAGIEEREPFLIGS